MRYFFVLLSLLPLWAFALEGYPLLYTFNSAVYGSDAGYQNWDITCSDRGEMFVANNNGVLRYDGHSWQSLTAVGQRVVRSVHAAGDRIYVGSHYEFGYLEENAYGEYDYQSLTAGSDLLNEDEDVWNIVSLGDRIYFQSFADIYVCENNVVRRLSTGMHPFAIYPAGGHLYVQETDGDFYVLEGNIPVPVIRREQIEGDRVVAFLESEKEGCFWVVTDRSGIYRMDRNGLLPFRTEADADLQRFAVNKACVTRCGNLVLGTYRSGMICVDSQGRLQWHYSSDSGLTNDCVLRLYCDSDDAIWACLDDGLACVAEGTPYRVISSKTHNQSLGMVYSMYKRDTEWLLATNQGVYRCSTDDMSTAPQLLPGTEGQSWYLTEVGGRLFCGHNSALLQWRDGRFEPVPGTHSSTCMRAFTIREEHYAVESSYYELRLHHFLPDGRDEMQTFDGFHHPVFRLEVDNDGAVWATDFNEGVYRIEWNEAMDDVARWTYYPAPDSLRTRCFVMRFGGKVLFSNSRRLYEYDSNSDSFRPFTVLDTVLPSVENIVNVVPSGKGGYWFCSKTWYVLVDRTEEGWRVLRTLPLSALGFRGNDVAAGVCENEGVWYFNMADAVVMLPQEGEEVQSDVPFFLHRAWMLDQKSQILPIALQELNSGSARIRGNLRLQFSYPDYAPNGVSFHFRLTDRGRIYDLQSDVPEIYLPAMDSGRKVLTAQAVAADGTVLQEQTLYFEVPVPWYFRWWVMLLWIVLLAAVVAVSFQWWFKKQTERQRLLLLEKEQVISEQQKQLLQNELELKSKDLASLSLDATIKNNVIQSVRQAIRSHQKQGNIVKGALNAELLRINQTMGSEKNWEVFQQNFDLIHEHFFRHLKEQYPSLTSGDLRLCALLRLNMSTKDIAGYTGLSVRGVESARFRLRKKLNLESDSNLSEFLLAFK